MSGLKSKHFWILDDGNRLTAVAEAAADYDVAGSFEYKKAKGSEYIYNSNGSLVADKSRGIAYITYDVNNNPQNIYFTNGNETRYMYSASGEKLRVTHYVAMPNITRTFGVKPEGNTTSQIIFAGQKDYLLGGSLVMQEEKIDKVLFDGGYMAAERLNTTTYGFTPYYYNQDHLGNNREVVNGSGTVQQVTRSTSGRLPPKGRKNYYPSGAPYADPVAVVNVSFQPYKYDGKELDLMHGLNTYDYGARQYAPILARWDRVDPLCEKYYSTSPYAYCHNNPIYRIDPSGSKDTVFVSGKDKSITEDTSTRTPLFFDDGTPNSGAYNCHTFAWSYPNGDLSGTPDAFHPRWDNYPENNMSDYNLLDSNEPNKVDDRVIYFIDMNSDGKYQTGEDIVHSAIVWKVDKEGYTIEVISKMGQGGLSINHPRAPGFYDSFKGSHTSRAYFRKKSTIDNRK